MDEALRRLEERADRQARKLARTISELARLRAEASWAGLTPEERRARIREQARQSGPAAAIVAFLAVCWAAVKRPEVTLAVMAGALLVGLGPPGGPDQDFAPMPPISLPPPAQPGQPAPSPSPDHRPTPMDSRDLAQGGAGGLDDMPEPPSLPSALPSPGVPELTPVPTPLPNAGPTPTAAPSPEPPPDEDDCLHLDLTLIDLVICLPPVGPRS